MNKSIIIICLLHFFAQSLFSQKRIGINTTTPQAMLHVKDSSVLFSQDNLPATPGDPPASGAGLRMMWYGAKAAFRAGQGGPTFWNKDSIGLYSFAAGNTTKAKGDYSIALGFNCQANDDYSVALGRQVTTNGTASVALGYGTNASALASTALGYFNTASGSYSTALGFSTTSIGQMTLSTGYDTEAEGIVSIAGGYRSVSTGSYSVSVGFQSHALPFASLAIGRYNNNTAGTSDTWVATDPVFMIGNGIDAANRSNGFTVLKNGKTAINADSAQAALYIKGYDASENSHIFLEDNNSTQAGKIYFTGDLNFKNTRVGGDFYFRDDANTMILSLFSTGNMTITGTLTQNSDSRLKKDFGLLVSPLEKVTNLRAYHFRWIDQARDQSLQTGFKAQEIEPIMPELVTTDENGIKSVNHIGMIPYLVEAIKELKTENEELKKELGRLKKGRGNR